MRLRAGPVAEDGGVGDEAGLRLPQVELVAGRLESEADPGIRYEVEADLMRRARRGAGDRAGKAAVDRAVEMTAQDAFDLRMAPDDRGKPDVGYLVGKVRDTLNSLVYERTRRRPMILPVVTEV